MNQFASFIINHYQILMVAIAIILDVVIIIVKRRPVKSIIDDSFTKEILKDVITAEKMYGKGHGSEKLKFVIDLMVNKHPNLKGYEDLIKSSVEEVLSSPQKKGVS